MVILGEMRRIVYSNWSIYLLLMAGSEYHLQDPFQTAGSYLKETGSETDFEISFRRTGSDPGQTGNRMDSRRIQKGPKAQLHTLVAAEVLRPLFQHTGHRKNVKEDEYKWLC